MPLGLKSRWLYWDQSKARLSYFPARVIAALRRPAIAQLHGVKILDACSECRLQQKLHPT